MVQAWSATSRKNLPADAKDSLAIHNRSLNPRTKYQTLFFFRERIIVPCLERLWKWVSYSGTDIECYSNLENLSLILPLILWWMNLTKKDSKNIFQGRGGDLASLQLYTNSTTSWMAYLADIHSLLLWTRLDSSYTTSHGNRSRTHAHPHL